MLSRAFCTEWLEWPKADAEKRGTRLHGSYGSELYLECDEKRPGGMCIRGRRLHRQHRIQFYERRDCPADRKHQQQQRAPAGWYRLRNVPLCYTRLHRRARLAELRLDCNAILVVRLDRARLLRFDGPQLSPRRQRHGPSTLRATACVRVRRLDCTQLRDNSHGFGRMCLPHRWLQRPNRAQLCT